MKKLLKKRYFLPLLIVAVMAIAAASAYAWWTASVSVAGNAVTTGTAGLEYGGPGVPISAAGLVPQATLEDDAVAAVPAGYKVSYFYVKNNGDAPLHVVGWLDNWTGSYVTLGAVVHVKITIAPDGSPWDRTGSLSAVGGPYLVYNGAIDQLYGKALGRTHLTTVGHEPLAAGQSAIYRVVTWLDGPSCNNDSQGLTMGCSLEFSGAQDVLDL